MTAVVLAALYTGSHAHKYGTETSETNDSSHLHGHNCLWKIILQFEIYWHYLLVSAFFALYSTSSYTKRWQDGEKGKNKHPVRFIRLSDVLIGSRFFNIIFSEDELLLENKFPSSNDFCCCVSARQLVPLPASFSPRLPC